MALHYACIRGHENVVRLLLQRNATVNSRDVDGKTPLALSVERKTPLALSVELDFMDVSNC
jgi:ankyrin repeat protein